MSTALVFLTYLASILLLGVLCTLISRWFKIPNTLLLLITGIILGHIKYQGLPLVSFPPVFITSLAIFALAMVVFDSSTKFKLKAVDQLSLGALKLSFLFLLMNIVFLSLAAWLIFDIPSIYFVLLFSALMTGTDPSAVSMMLERGKSRVFEFLKLESIINTPITVLFPFIILDFMRNVKEKLTLPNFIDQILPFLQQFVTGIGAGILMGLILFKAMRKQYAIIVSQLSMVTAALLAYIIAENLGGNGVLAVTTLGLFFGNVYIKEKYQLEQFSSIFANSLTLLVFILVGLTINIPLNTDFLIKSSGLFLIYLFIRYLSIRLAFHKQEYTNFEKLFMALNVQKGIAVPVVALTFLSLGIPGIEIILNLALAFLLYSIFVSTIVIKLLPKRLTE